ncbi:MAG: mechanosensitive ion channel family protein [Deltaproteobacteria bacterium]|nr:mechanosensitive ion channel family protein [Deltaproteobacteria bacterium]
MAYERFLIPTIAAAGCFVVLAALRIAIFKLFRHWSSKTSTRMDNIVVASLSTPSWYWCIAIALSVGVEMSDIPGHYVRYIKLTIDVLIILSITIATANLAGRLFTNYVQRADLPIPPTGLMHGVIKGTIVIIGCLIVLNTLGISIAPLLTALGVGGLAVALALQDTLANLFAGIHIILERSVRIGDFVKLESGQEGYVEDITWRTTRVRMLPNNMVIIPNSKLSKSVVTNYYLPEKRLSLLIPISVSYASDPAAVEQMLVDEAKRSVGEIPGLLGDPEPFVRFIPGFGESSLDFTLICQIGEFVDQYFAQHELRKRIFERFRREGVEIPFPQRTVHIREET